MNQHRDVKLSEYLRAMEGLDYPTSRSAIKNRAADTGGLDTEVLRVLDQLPDRSYESREDLLEQISEIYRAGSTFGGAAPAAPSPLDDREKNLVREMADPRRGEPYTPDGDEGDTDRRAIS